MSGDVPYAPFGETYAESGSPDLSFTGQNPDTNANLYDFMYREYGIQGRWPSPDPLGPGAFNLADPQSLDLYAYVRNNPTTFVDPLGLCPTGTVPVVWGDGQTYCQVMSGLGGGGGGGSDCYSIMYTNCNSPVGSPGGSGGGGTGTQPPPQPQTQATKQNYQQCMSSFTSSTTGEAISLFSALNFFSNWKEWLFLGGAKAAGVGALKAEASATVTDYSITAGTAATATTGLETTLSAGSYAAGAAGGVATAGATLLDASQRLACGGQVSPEGEAALAGPILFPFP